MALLPAVAAAQSDLAQAPRDATPLTVVTPDFPAGADVPPGGVRVELTGTVLVNGEFKPETITAEGDHPRFVAAVSEVLKWWRFRPAIDKDRCVPIDSPSKASVWFEGSSTAPRVFVSSPASQPPPTLPKLESIWSPKIGYSSGVEGQVVMLMLVTPDGEIKASNVRTSTPAGYFDAVVLKSTKRTLITWQEPRPQGDVCTQREHLFCMEDERDVKLPFQACRALRKN